jgi:hypothetical protein
MFEEPGAQSRGEIGWHAGGVVGERARWDVVRTEDASLCSLLVLLLRVDEMQGTCALRGRLLRAVSSRDQTASTLSTVKMRT